MRLRGFTLLELVIALVLGGAVVAVGGNLAVALIRQVETMFVSLEAQTNLQATGAFLKREFRWQSNADVVVESAKAMVYRHVTGFGVLCGIPDPSTGRFALMMLDGSEPLVGDSVAVFASRVLPGRWYSTAVTDVAPARNALCSGDVELELAGGVPLEIVDAGAPVEVFSRRRLRIYRDSRGSGALGMSELKPSSGWTLTQPLIGGLDHLQSRIMVASRLAEFFLVTEQGSIRLVQVGLAP